MPASQFELRLGALFLLVVGGVLLAYQLGWSGSFHFDDEPNLAALNQFLTTGDTWSWIASGDSGPGGRPLALASFLLDAPNWPHDPSRFLYTNTLIHVLNGLLLALVLLRLARSQTLPGRDAQIAALIGAALWMALPLLASSSLLIVQRMTLLAATFMWAGFWLYLIGRDLGQQRPARGTLVMLAGLVGGTGLGFFSKENAALLPILILVTELTLLTSKPLCHRGWQLTRGLMLGVPTVLIVLYLAQRLPGIFEYSPARGYTLSERVATQTLILWDYVRLLFLPRSIAFTPFHDAYPATNWSAQGYLASVAGFAWLLMALLAIATRKRWPLFAFATLWFLGAHLLESSVIFLELYFEHRNYVAAVGPVFALALGAWQLAAKFQQRRVVALFFSAYLGMLLLVLAQTTSMWGQPRLAVEIWYQQAPASLRAAPMLADMYIQEGDLHTAARILEQTRELRPESLMLSLQALQVDCQRGRFNQIPSLLDESRHRASQGSVDTSVIEALDTLGRFVREDFCTEALTLEDLAEIATLSLKNPAMGGGSQNVANLNVFLAHIYIDKRNLGATMQALESAWDAKPDLALLSFSVAVLNSAGLQEQALEFAMEKENTRPFHPLKRLQWEREYATLLESQRARLSESPGKNELHDTHFPGGTYGNSADSIRNR